METFSALLTICAGNSPVPVNPPHKGPLRGALMFSLICVWINGWVNIREAGDLRRYRYDVTVMRSGYARFYFINVPWCSSGINTMLNFQENFHKPIWNTGMEIKHASKSIQFVHDKNNEKFAMTIDITISTKSPYISNVDYCLRNVLLMFLFCSVLRLIFTRGQFWPSGIVIAPVCVSVSVCVCINHLLVRTITHQPFKLESPNLKHRCKTPWLRCLLFWGVIDLELQGQI